MYIGACLKSIIAIIDFTDQLLEKKTKLAKNFKFSRRQLSHPNIGGLVLETEVLPSELETGGFVVNVCLATLKLRSHMFKVGGIHLQENLLVLLRFF